MAHCTLWDDGELIPYYPDADEDTARQTVEAPSPPEEHPIADAVLASLRQTFQSYGHFPSEDGYKGLWEIAQTLERMAKGTCDPKAYLSSLPPGIGKTTTLVHTVKAILDVSELDHVAVLICLSRLEEIEKLALEMGLPQEQFACLTADEKINRLGSSNVDSARVLFTTQEMLRKRAKHRDSFFAELSEFHFKGKPRQVRVWDETIDVTKSRCITRDQISELYAPLRRKYPELTSELETWNNSIIDKETGEIVRIPEIHTKLERSEFLSCFGSQKRKAAEDLYDISSREVRVRREGGNVTTLSYEEALPPDLSPILVLDASGHVKKTYDIWEGHRRGDANQLVRLFSPQKTYRNLTIHLCDMATGVDKLRDPERANDIVSHAAAKIDEIPTEEELLVVYRKLEDHEPDIGTLIREKAQTGDRIRLLTYGKHRATNEFSHIKHVFLIGTLQYTNTEYEATGRGAKGAKLDDAYTDEEVRYIRDGELMDHILQAACRGEVRKAQGNDCPDDCRLYVMASGRSAVSQALLQEVFPMALFVTWEPFRKKPRRNTLKMVNALHKLVTTVSVGESMDLRTNELLSVADFKHRSSLQDVWDDPILPATTMDRGYKIARQRGMATVTKVKEVPYAFIDLPF